MLPSKKTGTEGPDKVGSAGEHGFTRALARLQGQNRLPLWYPQVESKSELDFDTSTVDITPLLMNDVNDKVIK